MTTPDEISDDDIERWSHWTEKDFAQIKAVQLRFIAGLRAERATSEKLRAALREIAEMQKPRDELPVILFGQAVKIARAALGDE